MNDQYVALVTNIERLLRSASDTRKDIYECYLIARGAIWGLQCAGMIGRDEAQLATNRAAFITSVNLMACELGTDRANTSNVATRRLVALEACLTNELKECAANGDSAFADACFGCGIRADVGSAE